jgi:hypothetical protein
MTLYFKRNRIETLRYYMDKRYTYHMCMCMYATLLLFCCSHYNLVSNAFIITNSPSTCQHQHQQHLYQDRSSRHAVNINHEAIFNDLDVMYTDASKTIKCPFFRRRVADSIDNVAMVLKFLIIRHKSLLNDVPIDLLLDADANTDANTEAGRAAQLQVQIPGCKSMGQRNPDGTVFKYKHLELEDICNVIEKDWSVVNNRGYYITGRLNTTIYRDDCLFDGPDPDMPVRGLRKYLAAASNLFEAKNSFAKLQKIQIVEAADVSRGAGKFGHGVIEVQWKLGGVLMLPWRPKVKPWSGWTRYHLDEDGLIAFHEEGWDISVLEAFIGTMFPEIGDRIWDRDVDLNEV